MSCCGESEPPKAGSSAVAIIQARLTSSRLPRKILADVGGRPLLQHVLDRARAITGIDDVIIAVPDAATRTEIMAALVLGETRIFVPMRAEPYDVLARFAEASDAFRSHDVLVRITADCPLLAPEVADEVIARYRSTPDCTYAWNDTHTSGFPDGTDVEVFSRELLLKVHGETRDYDHIEHVTPYMRQIVKPVLHRNPTPWTGPTKISVDTAEELALVNEIFKRLKPGDFSLAATAKAAKGL